MDISIVVPLYNEEESLPELIEWIDKVCTANQYQYEVIMVNDGSSDSSWEVVQDLAQQYPAVKGISFRRNYGKAAALNEGFQAAQGEVVITMDADLQDSPDEIPELRRMIVEDGFDLVSGWKKKRHDPITKTIPTKLYNWATRKMSGIYLHDMNCGLKSYRNAVVKSVEVYGDMHRYIPVMAKQAGFNRIGEKVVQHQARKYGVTKFGLERFINGFLDLLTITFITRFGKKPMHFFGTVGTLFFFLGGIITFWLLVSKAYSIYIGDPNRLVAENPLFFIALTMMIIGVQLFLAGFLAELISRSSPDRNKYEVAETLRLNLDAKSIG